MTESRRSAACANEQHTLCPHLMYLRLTGSELCRCACHISCPASGADTAELGAWWDVCTCPGAEHQRAEGRRRWGRDRPPTMYEAEQQLRTREIALSRARATLAANAKGLPADAVRQLLVEELRAQGAALPPESVLEREVGRIQRTAPPGAGLSSIARALASSFLQKRSVEREFRSPVKRPHTLQGPHGEPPYVMFNSDHSLPMVDVASDQESLRQVASAGDEVFVSLLSDAGKDTHLAAVFIDDHQVGILPPAESALYQPAMAAARENGAVLMVKGIVEIPADGENRLRIFPAGIL